MKKVRVILLWPYVYFLDWLISLTGAQTFEESRRISRMHYHRIINGDKSVAADDSLNPTSPQPPHPAEKSYFRKILD